MTDEEVFAIESKFDQRNSSWERYILDFAATIRAAALEEAAKVAEATDEDPDRDSGYRFYGTNSAAAIRALVKTAPEGAAPSR